MEDFQHVGYSKEVIEFVAVAKEFCDFVETAPQMQRRDFIQRLQKFIPLIYLKGSLLPESDSGDSGLIEDIVTEDDYNYLYGQLHRLLGEHDEYLEVFDDNMQFSEVPVVHSIAEKTCDIYQDLKNFISSFRCGIPEVIGEALWQLNNSFELYWGKACAGVLRAVHHAVYLRFIGSEQCHGFRIRIYIIRRIHRMHTSLHFRHFISRMTRCKRKHHCQCQSGNEFQITFLHICSF